MRHSEIHQRQADQNPSKPCQCLHSHACLDLCASLSAAAEAGRMNFAGLGEVGEVHECLYIEAVLCLKGRRCGQGLPRTLPGVNRRSRLASHLAFSGKYRRIRRGRRGATRHLQNLMAHKSMLFMMCVRSFTRRAARTEEMVEDWPACPCSSLGIAGFERTWRGCLNGLLLHPQHLPTSVGAASWRRRKPVHGTCMCRLPKRIFSTARCYRRRRAVPVMR